jgi:hypothetical protein
MPVAVERTGRAVQVTLEPRIQRLGDKHYVAWCPSLDPWGPVGVGKTEQGAVWALRLKLAGGGNRSE